MRLAEGTHLEPMAEKHDRDEQCQLPPVVQVEPTERRRGAGDERDSDREADEQHHAGLALLQLIPPSLQEDPAAVDEDNGAENRRDPIAAGELRQGEVEPVLDHLAEEDDRDREDQRDPEFPAEERLMAGMPSVTGMRIVTAVTGMRIVIMRVPVGR